MREELKKGVVWGLFIIAVVATFIKPFYGIDCDEVYIVELATRLLQGDHMFKEMWEIHQTSAFPAAIILTAWKSVTGGYESSYLFLRITYGFFQICIALISYFVLKKEFGVMGAGLSATAILAFLPRGTQNFEYGVMSVDFFWLALLTLYFISNSDKIKNRSYSPLLYFLASFFFSMAILSYPTMIVVCAFIIPYFFLYDKSGFKWFVLGGIICGFIFIMFVLKNISTNELLSNIKWILSDGSHSSSGIVGAFERFIPEKDKLIQAVLILGTSVVCYYLSKLILKRDIKYLFWVMLTSSLVIIFLNITGIRISGVMGFNIRYILIILFSVPLCIKKRDATVWLFYFTGLGILFGSLIGSNLTIVENAGFAAITVVAIILIVCNVPEYQDAIIQACIVAFVFSLVFIKGFIVRIQGTKPAIITEKRELVENGVLKGIYIYPEEKDSLLIKEKEIKEMVLSDDVPLIISRNNIYYTMFENKYTTANCISTPRYDSQWVEYYSNRDYGRPTVVVIDKRWFEYEEFVNDAEFGRYLCQTMGFDKVTETDNFVCMR